MRRRTLFGQIGIVGYGEWEISISANPTTVANTGGTVAISATASRLIYWSDGSTITETGIPSISVSTGDYSNGTLTLGVNTSNSVKTITISATIDGVTNTLDISQAGKTITSYGEWAVSVSASPSSGISAAGGTSTITCSASRTVTWTDNSTTTETATPTLETNLGSISGNILTLGANTNTSTRTATVTASHGGKSATCTVTQNADSVAAYGDVNLTVGTIADVPASGGSRTSTGSNATQVLTWVSGRTTTVYPTITEGTISNVGSKGTTVSDRTSLGTVTITATGQGSKSASKTLTVYQQANSASYGAVSISSHGSAIDIPAAGGDRTASGGSGTQKVTYTSGSERAGTVTCGSYSKVSASSLGTTEKARTHVGTSTATLTGEGSKTATVSVKVYQAANAITNSNYNPYISAYGTPSVSIGSGITAGGGSATVSHSVSNTQTYYHLYTSGSTTTHTRSVAGTTTIKIQSNGNNRFSLSNTKLSHSSMGTSETTDTCTVRATNAGSTGKYKDASVSVTNSKSISGYTNQSKSLTASKTSVSSSKNTVTLTASFTTTTNYKYSSGSTSSNTGAEGVTLSITSGSSYASLSGTTLTINANTGTSSRSVTVQAKGNNSGATTTVTITQESNYCNVSICAADGTLYYNFGVGKSGSVRDQNCTSVTVTRGDTGTVSYSSNYGNSMLFIDGDAIYDSSASVESSHTNQSYLSIQGDYYEDY